MKKKGFSLIEIMVILGALGGIALLVTKMGSNTMNIKNESITTNDYNDLVREAHFLLSNNKACKVSLAGTKFITADSTSPINNIELWTADSRGQNRMKKRFAKDEKFASLQIEDVTLTLDPVTTKDPGNIQNTTALLRIKLVKPKTKSTLLDIEHSINVNYTINNTDERSSIIDCDEKREVREEVKIDTKTWCGTIQNPCGTEIFQVVAIGRYENGKFTGVFQPTTLIEGKICYGAINHTATLTLCAQQAGQ